MHQFRQALQTDAEVIVRLVNAAYRGDSSRAGWTTEADLLDGLRATADEIGRLIASTSAIILLCQSEEELLGTVCIEQEQDAVHVGMFVVKPVMQGSGIGKQLLAEAERLALQKWAPQKFKMYVITMRHELIAFYERRGYQRTGILRDFPINPTVWQPKLAGLKLEMLEKTIIKHL
ncbi:putative acetyltransferase [mine drainage metagenome]|uniref:Putative acetyltransferase n=1 Tax=mine drainage metagenome TaxID=410659 RepID=A0A1J5S9A3_9ZZZZ